ncbi:MAG: hypothetical protein IT475_03610 [Aquimonas sp.]|nr:hypothetical protein [Aquimonas sp.]
MGEPCCCDFLYSTSDFLVDYWDIDFGSAHELLISYCACEHSEYAVLPEKCQAEQLNVSHDTSSWTIENNRLLEDRAKQAAWLLADECEREATSLDTKTAAAREKFGAALTVPSTQMPPRPNATASRVEVENYVRDLKAATREGDRQLSASIAALDVGARLACLAAVIAVSATPSMADTIKERRETAARVIGRLPGDVPDEVRTTILKMVDRLFGAADDNTAINAEMALRVQVQTAQEDSQQREQQRACAVKLRGRLMGLEGSDLTWANDELIRVERGERALNPQLIQRIERIEAEAKRRVDRQYATQVIKNAFVALGYSVEEGFETAFSEGGAVHFEHAELHEYVLEFEAEPSNAAFHAHLVREATDGLDPDGSPAYRQMRDVEVEKILCTHLRQVRKEMNANGMQVRLEDRIAPGTLGAVKVVQSERTIKKGRATPGERAVPRRR